MSSLIIPDNWDQTRLDKAMATLCDGLSRARVQSLIADGQVQLNGAIERNQKIKVRAGDTLIFTVPEPEETHLKPENIPLDIVFEDESLLVINKQAGLVVHPGAGQPDGTLVNALLHHCGADLSGIGGVARPGIVHRLDKETSGLMMVAKTDVAHRGLADQLADRSLSRTYEALIWEVPMPPLGVIDKAIGRHPQDRLRMSTRGVSMREARTHYKVLKQEENRQLAHIECALETGRTHQIRVHFQTLNHCLIGDTTYGAQVTKQKSCLNKSSIEKDKHPLFLTFPRQALHAKAIRFIHPVTGEECSHSAPPPHDLQTLIDLL